MGYPPQWRDPLIYSLGAIISGSKLLNIGYSVKIWRLNVGIPGPDATKHMGFMGR